MDVTSAKDIPQKSRRNFFHSVRKKINGAFGNAQREGQPLRFQNRNPLVHSTSNTKLTNDCLRYRIYPSRYKNSNSLSDFNNSAISNMPNSTYSTRVTNQNANNQESLFSEDKWDARLAISNKFLNECRNSMPQVFGSSFQHCGDVTEEPGYNLALELKKLSKYGWYWGPLPLCEAETKLAAEPEGAFLVRDSSDDKYLLSLSFNANGRIYHTRFEYINGYFSFAPHKENDVYRRSLNELIEYYVSKSKSENFCTIIHSNRSIFHVKLTKPVSRFMQVKSLQHLCRFVIRQHISVNHIEDLHLPKLIKLYLSKKYF